MVTIMVTLTVNLIHIIDEGYFATDEGEQEENEENDAGK